MTVCFCGHSDLHGNYDKIKQKCFEVVEKLILESADTFFVGNYGAFDNLAATVCLSLRESYPVIKVNLILPYYRPHVDTYTQERLSRFNETLIPPLEGTPHRYRIVKANQYMVDQSDIVVAYVESQSGGAARTLRYAAKTGRRTINIAK